MKSPKYESSVMRVLPVCLIVLVACSVLGPLSAMLLNIDKISIDSVMRRQDLWTVIGNSFLSAGLTTLLSILMAWLMALCTERTAMPGKEWFRVLITIPMLIPSVSIGMGVVMLGGNNGLLTHLLGRGGVHVYGLTGIVWGSVMYCLPVAYLMLADVLRYEDSAPYEAARILGISGWHRFVSITLPYLRKPLIAACFSVFTLSFTDYGVPLMVGGKFKTLPVLLYQDVIGQLDFGKGSVYGVILLIPAVIASFLDLANRNRAGGAFVVRPFQCRRRPLDAAAFLAVLAVTAGLLLPVLSFVVMAFVRKYPGNLALTLSHVAKTVQMGGGRYLLNSVVIALCVAVIGVVTCVLCAYITARARCGASGFLHLTAMATGAIPGVVLGLAYVLFFRNTSIYGTLAILVLVNVVHFFASPYLMIYTSFSKLNENLEAVGATLGIGRMRILKDVLLPGCRATLMEMFSFYFVNCMMTISAVSFLANTRNKPVALMINQFEAQALMEPAAVVSLMILSVNVVVKVLTSRIKNRTLQ